jgi:hypothetical protein
VEDLLSLARLLAALLVGGGIIYAIYRWIRWQFPRLGRFRARLVTGLGTAVIAASAISLFGGGAAQCLQHENTVLLRGQRVINFRQAENPKPVEIGSVPYQRVVEACGFLADHCPIAGADDTRRDAAAICENALAGAPLD